MLVQSQVAEAEKSDPDQKHTENGLRMMVIRKKKELRKITMCIHFYLGNRDSLEIKMIHLLRSPRVTAVLVFVEMTNRGNRRVQG